MVRARRVFSLTAVLVVMALVAAACPRETVTKPPGVEVQEGGQIVFAAEQEPTGWNINTSKDSLFWLGIIVARVWPSAYRARPDFSVEPILIDGKADLVTEDPFVVEWKIKEEADWSDGVPVSSDDFEFYYLSCNGKVDPGEPTDKDDDGKDVTALDCASTQGYDQITKFEKADEKTVRATFDPPYVEYESLFGNLPPSHEAKKRPGGWNSGFDPDPGPSAGPYEFVEWVKGDHITIKRNEKYWGTKPHIDTVIFRQLPDPPAAPTALQNDEVQVIYPSPQVDLVEVMRGISGIETEIGFGPTWEHLDFNFKNPLLAIKEVRESFAYGLDRTRIVDALMKPFSDDASRLDNRVFVSNMDQYEAHGQAYAKPDVAKAQAALEKAGFTKGADGIYAKGKDRLSFRLRVRTPNPLREQNEQLMQAQMKEVGVELRIDNFTTSLGAALAAGDFDLIIFAWVGTPFPASGAKQIFETGSDSNFGSYTNPEVDRLIREANTEPDPKKRADLLNQADEEMWKDFPNLPLFQRPSGLLGFSSRYANISDNTTTEGPTWNIEEWGLKKTAA